jgi:oxalate decarboxylase/phosphoglucose isomerase-like protein (cupin superfamily)
MGIENCRLFALPKITDIRGNLTVIESQEHIPFSIERIYYLYDVPAGETRAGHAHKQLQQLFVAVSGSFDITLDDGKESKVVHLNRPFQGLYVCPMIWREINNFSSGSVCLVLASSHYDELDYYRDYDTFLSAVRFPS